MMRLDKYLKVSRLIKRRTVANEACAGARVKVKDIIAKPSCDLKIGDIVEITFGNKSTKIEVVSVSEHAGKAEASAMYRVLGEN